MRADLERTSSALQQAEWCCLGMAMFCAVYGLLVAPQLLLAPVLTTTTLSVAAGALGGVRTILRTQADRMRQLEEELDRLRARPMAEPGILPAGGDAATDPVFMAPQEINRIPTLANQRR
jgi:hypothetical protein